MTDPAHPRAGLLEDCPSMEPGGSQDPVDCLRRAIVATRPGGGGPRRISSQLRLHGPEILSQQYRRLDVADARDIDQDAQRLAERGVRAVFLTDREYPAVLRDSSGAPPVLFYRGPVGLLAAPGVGICGSRRASADGLRAARSCATTVVAAGFTVISGYAKGVDTEAHLAALEGNGQTVAVLPDGIDHFRVKRGDLARRWDHMRVTVVSQFAPSQPWRAGTAMARNEIIVRLGRALAVVEAGEQGGTLDAGIRALDIGRRVLTLEVRDQPAAGNAVLVQRGAIAVRRRADLLAALAGLPTLAGPDQQLPLAFDS
jgi:DNA processing protein